MAEFESNIISFKKNHMTTFLSLMLLELCKNNLKRAFVYLIFGVILTSCNFLMADKITLINDMNVPDTEWIHIQIFKQIRRGQVSFWQKVCWFSTEWPINKQPQFLAYVISHNSALLYFSVYNRKKYSQRPLSHIVAAIAKFSICEVLLPESLYYFVLV